MKRLVATALVLFLAMPSVAHANHDRRRKNAAILLGTIAAAATVWWVVAANRTQTRTFQLISTDGGEPAHAMWTVEGLANSGPLQMTLGSEELQGRWTALDTGVDLSTIMVTTPSGPITALGLSQARAPTGVAVLDGPDVDAVCTWTGSTSAGVLTCADSHGHHYMGIW